MNLKGIRSVFCLIIIDVTTCLKVAAAQKTLPAVAPSAAPLPSKKRLLEQDIRLDRSISVQFSGVSFTQLLKLCSNNNLLLKTDQDSAEQKFQMRLKQRSLRSLLQGIAQLIPGTWEPLADGKGYTFHMTRQAIARRKEWWQLFLAQHEDARRVQRESVLNQLRAHPAFEDLKHADPKDYPLELQKRTVANQQFFNALPATIQEQIADHVTDIDEFTGFWTHGANEGAVGISGSELPETARLILQEQCAPFWQNHHARPEEATIVFTNLGRYIETSLTLSSGATTDTSLSVLVLAPPTLTMLPLEHPGIVSLVAKWGGNASRFWKALAIYQQSHVWPHDAPAFPVPKRPMRRADVLEWLGRQADIEYLADYYSRPGLPLTLDEKRKPLTHSFKAELDVFAESQDSSWKQVSNGLYLVRHNRWYRDDGVEVPGAFLDRWYAQLQVLPKTADPLRQIEEKQPEGEGLVKAVKNQLAWESQIVAALTPWQIAHGLTWAAVDTQLSKEATIATGSEASGSQAANTWLSIPGWNSGVTFPFLGIGTRLLKQRHVALFYGSLNEEQQTALLHDVLPAHALNAVQFEAAVGILPHLRVLAKTQQVLLGLQAEPSVAANTFPGTFAGGYDIHLTVKTVEVSAQ